MTTLSVSADCNNVGLAQLTWFKEEGEEENAKCFLEDIVRDELLQTRLQTKYFCIAGFSPGTFNRVKTVGKDDTFIYLHKRPWKWASSRITYDLFESALSPLVEEKEITPCGENLHPFLSPFFGGDTVASAEIKEWMSTNSDNDLLPFVTEVLELHHPNTVSKSSEYHLTEEDWTERLVKAMKCHPAYAKLLTCTGIKASKFATMKKDHVGIAPDCIGIYTINGGPDLYCWFPQLVITIDDSTELAAANLPATVASPGPNQNAEVDAFVGEHDRTAQPLTFPFPKMGELISNMHIASVDIIIKNGYEIRNSTVRGLFLHKSSGASQFQMDLVIDTETNNDYVFADYIVTRRLTTKRHLTQQLLCGALEWCTNLDLHKCHL